MSSPPWPRQLCPSPPGPWPCGSRSICTAPKLCRRQRRHATAHPVGPRTGEVWLIGPKGGERHWTGAPLPAMASSTHAPLSSVPTVSSLGPSPALRDFWVWSRVQEPHAGAAYGPSGPTHWCVLWACWALPSSSASSLWPPRAASWAPM
jgi:hypothetical protein